MPDTPAHFSHVVPFLPVIDLTKTIDFYKEKLGFYEEWFWTDPNGVITDAGCRRDDMRLLFSQSPEFVRQINSGGRALDLCWFVKGVDAIYEEYKARGVEIVIDIQDQPWGMREFTITDINGYDLRIGSSVSEKTGDQP